MTTTETTTVHFSMSGQAFVADVDIRRLDGPEVLLVEQLTAGTAMAWLRRIGTGGATGTDMLLLAYVARHRENPMLEWDFFVKTMNPYSVIWLGDEPAALEQSPAEEPDAPAPEKPATKPRAPRPSRARKTSATS